MAALVCSQCGTVAQPGAEFCPKCLGPVGPAMVASASSVPAPSVGEAARKPLAIACPRHPEHEVLGTCARCGGFLCVACLPAGTLEPANALCPDCEGGRTVRELPDQERTLFRSSAVAMLLFALVSCVFLMVGVGTELSDSKYSQMQSILVLALTFALHLPLLVCAVLTWAAHLRVAGWLGVLVECGMLVLMIAAGGFSLFWLLLGGTILVSGVQLLQVGALRHEARRKREARPPDTGG